MCWEVGFWSKSASAAWEFLEDLAKKTIQWKTTRDDNMSSRFSRDGMYPAFDVHHLKYKIIVLKNIFKGLLV